MLLSACLAEPPDSDQLRPDMGVAGDTSALTSPPEWPASVAWSDAIANEGLLATDADSDGQLDLVLWGRGQHIAYLARGLGAGRFEAPSVIRADRLGASAGSTESADLNADGRLDLVYLSTLSSNDAPRRARVTALLARGDGSFEPRVSDFDGYAGPLCVSDLDGDGQLDLIVAVPGSNQEPDTRTSLLVLGGIGDGTFGLRAPAAAQLSDFRTSQLLLAELASTQGRALLLLGENAAGHSRLAVYTRLAGALGAPQLVNELDEVGPLVGLTVDLDGDAQSELVLVGAAQRSLTSVRFVTDEAGQLGTQLTRHRLEGESYALADGFAVADVDADGTPDLLLPGSDTRSTEGFHFGPVLIVAHGDGLGGFGQHRVLQLAARDGEFGAHALSADLDGDGRRELLLSTYDTQGATGRTAVLFEPAPN